MEMLVFGEAGQRVLAFPTSMGRFFDWEDRGMVSALEALEAGNATVLRGQRRYGIVVCLRQAADGA
jgi:esterase/lipase superfamily enzyme